MDDGSGGTSFNYHHSSGLCEMLPGRVFKPRFLTAEQERLPAAHGQWLIGDSRCVHAFLLQALVAREHLSQLSKKRNWKNAAANNCQGDVCCGGELSQ